MAEERRMSASSLSGHHPMTRSFLKATYQGELQKVLSMLDDGVPVDVCNSAGLQAIHFAAKTGDVELITELLKHGATINAVSLRGNSPLHVASLIGRREVVKLLLRNGADVNSKSECNEDSFTPLYMAAQIGHQEIVTLLLAHGADPTLQTKNGSTAHDVAQQQGHVAVAELLQEYERRLKEISFGTPIYSSLLDSPTTLSSSPREEHNHHNRQTHIKHKSHPIATSTIGTPTNEVDSGGTPTRSGRIGGRQRPPAVYNRDVIPSPRNSPMKSRALLGVRLQQTVAASSAAATAAGTPSDSHE